MQIYLTNLSQYNNGFLIGEWLELPASKEELQDALSRVLYQDDEEYSIMPGRLTVIRKLTRNHRAYFECKCSCGTVKVIRADNVKSGSTSSCGCLSREKASERLKKLHKVY